MMIENKRKIDKIKLACRKNFNIPRENIKTLRLHHVFASHTTPHIAEIASNFPEIFDFSENIVDSVMTASEGFSEAKDARTRCIPKPISWKTFLWKSFRTRSNFLIVHGGYWPKVWLSLLFLTIFGKKIIFISWGGELQRVSGVKGFLRGLAMSIVIMRARKIIFLSASDASLATAAFGEIFDFGLIPYFNGKHEARARKSRSIVRPENSKIVVQIGNDASPINDHKRCLDAIFSANLQVTAFMPMGYGRYDAHYIKKIEEICSKTKGLDYDIQHSLLSQIEFDHKLEKSGALLIGSEGQRALYSIFSYLSMGKPVFVPNPSMIKNDLEALGFKLFDLDKFGQLIELDATWATSAENRNVVIKRLSLSSIRSQWIDIFAQRGKANG